MPKIPQLKCVSFFFNKDLYSDKEGEHVLCHPTRISQFQCHCQGIVNSYGYFVHFRLPSSSKQEPPLEPESWPHGRLSRPCNTKKPLFMKFFGFSIFPTANVWIQMTGWGNCFLWWITLRHISKGVHSGTTSFFWWVNGCLLLEAWV